MPWHRWAVAAFYACLAAVLLLTLTPITIPNAFPEEDKLHHLIAFGALAVLACASWSVPWWRSCLPLSALGALIELIQLYVPHRSAEVGDWLADSVGVGLGWYLYPAFRGLFMKWFVGANS